MDKASVERGIAAYRHEQTVLLRLLRRHRRFSADDFDRWLQGREYRRPRFHTRGIDGDSFLLGIGSNGFNRWAEWLELLQYMIYLSLVSTEREGSTMYYIAGPRLHEWFVATKKQH